MSSILAFFPVSSLFLFLFVAKNKCEFLGIRDKREIVYTVSDCQYARIKHHRPAQTSYGVL